MRIGTVVQAGDRLKLPPGALVTVQLADGKVNRYAGDREHTIPDARPLGKAAAILEYFSALLDTEFRLEKTAAARGGGNCAGATEHVAPIQVPVLVPGARITSGKRDLPLAWVGGCAPFIVTIHSGDQSIAERKSIEARQVRLDSLPLHRGRYVVSVSDGGGRTFRSTLDATDEGPVVPPDLATDSTPLGVVAQALWLAEYDGGRWRLDSFERLRPLIRAGDTFAGTIGDSVMWSTAKR